MEVVQINKDDDILEKADKYRRNKLDRILELL